MKASKFCDAQIAVRKQPHPVDIYSSVREHRGRTFSELNPIEISEHLEVHMAQTTSDGGDSFVAFGYLERGTDADRPLPSKILCGVDPRNLRNPPDRVRTLTPTAARPPQ